MNQFCECTEDRECPRYKRPMYGRMRQICMGENVDPGTAAHYRTIWLAEAEGKTRIPDKCPYLGEQVKEGNEPKTRLCDSCSGKIALKVFHCTHPAREEEVTVHQDCRTCVYAPRVLDNPRKLILKNTLCPGDVLVMSAAVHSLHKAHPGKFLTAVDTSCPSVWDFNPDIVPTEPDFEVLETHYPAVNQSNQRGIHFMEAYCEFFESALGVRVPLATNRPMIYLSRLERSWMSQVEEVTKGRTKYWLISCGYKSDYTTKFAGTEFYQKIVDLLKGRILFVQVGAPEHTHKPLKNVLSLVGQTDMRQLIRLAWNSDGGLGGVTFLQHLYAALEKPYACIMGGREPTMWNQYPRQQLFHTVGMLPCSSHGGCWKSRTVALGDGDPKDKELCDSPTFGEEPVPKCMAIIDPEQIAETIARVAVSHA